MDLLDSILSGMEKPPTVKRPEIKDKDKREKMEKLAKERQEAARKQKEAMSKFRSDLDKKIKDFTNYPTTDAEETYKLELKPMNKLYRSIVHEVCDDHEDKLVVHSFGTEELDRHCIIWKLGYEPCEEEIRAMKLGVEYKPPKSGDDEAEEEEDQQPAEAVADKFRSKYERIIGENASGLESARAALPARQYGCVPIENKKDQRSIEQMMDDIRRSKRQKVDEAAKEEGEEEGEKESRETKDED